MLKIGNYECYGVNEMMMSYKIKELRKKRGDTLKSLAQKLNYDFSNLSKIERGIHRPSLPLLEKIASVYNVGLDYFLDLHQYSREEREFMAQFDLGSENFLGYQFYLDGQKLSEHELGSRHRSH